MINDTISSKIPFQRSFGQILRDTASLFSEQLWSQHSWSRWLIRFRTRCDERSSEPFPIYCFTPDVLRVCPKWGCAVHNWKANKTQTHLGNRDKTVNWWRGASRFLFCQQLKIAGVGNIHKINNRSMFLSNIKNYWFHQTAWSFPFRQKEKRKSFHFDWCKRENCTSEKLKLAMRAACYLTSVVCTNCAVLLFKRARLPSTATV